MDVEALASLESQVSFCKSIVDRVTGSECFILLSGEPQSGRSVICEHVVNATDNKLRAVFIPSSRDMPLQRLRTMFLQQLLPGCNVDKDLNLADALAAERIPHNQKVLVVVDDVDAAGSAFFNELLMLHTQFKGQERFAFLVVCSPLWAEEKMQHINDDSVINMQIPPLAMKDALVLSKHIFAMHNAMRVYNSVSGRLADALAKAGGNLGKIVSITESLMKEPAIPPRAAGGRRAVSGDAVAQGKQKKHSSSVSIFVSIVCIVIVLACLVPILFGSGIFSSSDEQETSVTVPAAGFPVQADGSVSAVAEYDEDTGVIPKNVPKGSVDVKSDNAPSRSVTLSGEELDRIEGGAVDSGYPRRMERPVAVPQKVVLQREDNLNRIKPQANSNDSTAIDVVRSVTPPDPVIPSVPSFVKPEEVAAAQAQQQKIAEQMKAEEKKRLEDAAKAKLEADRKAAAAAEKAKEKAVAAEKAAAEKEKEKEKTAAAPARPALKAGQIINLADEQKAISAQRTSNAQPAAGSVAEGSVQELLRADGKHFTVQIVSASNRANISAAAGKLSGKYWILETRRSGRPWYVLIAGEYANRAEAARAAAAIPTAVSQGAKPFVRSIAEIKADLGRN